MDLGCFSGNGLPLGRLIFVNLIRPVGAGAGPVGGNNGDFEFVGFFELHLLGFGRAGHAGQAGIEKEEVLIGDAGEGLGFGLNLQALLGFHRLVQAVAPAAAGHDAAGEFINDHRITGANDVVHILHEQFLGLEGIEDVMGPGIGGVIKIIHAQQALSGGVALIGEGHVALFLINLVITLGIDAILAHFR